ncbi:MAG: hypothetical protein H6739_17070 [Alphaproteobacteria bacterium]|nr:hypothetical protein [Alphaproteobacteria bacterium]
MRRAPVRPAPSLLPLLCAAALSACSGGDVEFDVTLVPVVAGNQTPFSGLDRLVLRLEPSAGQSEAFELAATTGSPQLEGLGELEDTRVALEGYAGDTLISFGRSTPMTVLDGEERTEHLLVADVDRFAWLNNLDEDLSLGAAAPDGTGRFFTFGGVDDLSIGFAGARGSDHIWRVDIAPVDPDLGLSFVDAGVSMPSYTADIDGSSHTERMGHTATLLRGTGADEGMILVAGGGERFLELDTTTYHAFLFDPDTSDIIELGDGLASSRANHLAVVNQVGDVVLFGGWGAASGNSLVPRNTAEVYSRAERDFEIIPSVLPGDGLYGAAASVGTYGVLYCGGAELLGGTWKSITGCSLVSPSYELRPVADLPEPMSHASMVSLGEGRAMIIGGLSVDAADNVAIQFQSVPAIRSTYLYDAASDSWSAGPDLQQARAYHKAVVLPDGRVLVIGGASAGEMLFADASAAGGPALACVEVYDPDDDAFEVWEGCAPSDASGPLPNQNHWPTVAVDPVYGVLVAGGTTTSLTGLSSAALWVSDPGDR